MVTTDSLLKNVMKRLNENTNNNISSMTIPDFNSVLSSNTVTVLEKKIKHVWEVDRHLCCPLIGGCLTIEEHKKVLNKAGVSTGKKRPYELHNIIMCNLDDKNRVSQKVDNFLRYKYRKEIPSLRILDEGEFLKKWNRSMETGGMESIYFVAAVRNDLSSKIIEQIFGDVHMINHINLHEINRVKKRVTMHEKTNVKLARLFQQQKKKNISLKKEMSVLKNSITDLANINRTLKNLAKINNCDSKEIIRLRNRNHEFKNRIAQLEKQASRLSSCNKGLERDNKKLEEKNNNLESFNHQLAEEIKIIADAAPCINKRESCRGRDCPKLSFCPGRILIVGGRTRMKQHYKNLIEAYGGEFEYHDGCMKGGEQNLEHRIRRSDIVICPVNCNSHGACESVKKYCRIYRKPFKMLPSSGITSIFNAMVEDAHKN